MAESSSCGAPERETYGRQGIGITQPQSGTDYPFVLPSEDVRYLLADFWLAYDEPSDYPPNLGDTPFKGPFRIHWLYGFGCDDADAPDDMPTPTHAADLLVVDSDNVVVFDSTLADEFTSRAWGSRLHIYSWQTADAVCRVVVHTAWSESDNPPARDYPIHLLPEDGVLDERAVERRPKRVKSLKVVLDSLTKQGVDFRAGYNISIAHSKTDAVPGGRFTQQIKMDAAPGSGLGIFPGCVQPPLLVRSFRGIRPSDAGAFFMAATDCYYFRQPTTLTASSPIRIITPTPAMLMLGNDCTPCCGCDDYVSAAEYLNNVRDQYHALGVQTEDSRDLYHENRERWLTAAACAARKPLRLVLQAQYCPTLDVVAQFCNKSDECVGPVDLQIILGAGYVGTLVPGYSFATGGQSGPKPNGSARYDIGGAWPTFTAHFDVVQPHASAAVKFRLKFGDVCDDDTPVIVNGSLLASVDSVQVTITPEGGGDPITAVATATEPLDCPAAYPRVDPYSCCT